MANILMLKKHSAKQKSIGLVGARWEGDPEAVGVVAVTLTVGVVEVAVGATVVVPVVTGTSLQTKDTIPVVGVIADHGTTKGVATGEGTKEEALVIMEVAAGEGLKIILVAHISKIMEEVL